MEKQPKIAITEVKETTKELTKEELKKLKQEERKREKERKKIEQYYRTLATRGEVIEISKRIVTQEVKEVAEFYREPVRVNIMQTMALIELLKEKGIIESDEEFQKYIDKIAEKLKEN